MLRCLILIITALSFSVHAAENVSLSKVLMKFQGDEYNMLLAPKQVVINKKKRKTEKAIQKGFSRSISEVMRQVKLRDIALNLKVFTPRGSNLEQYRDEDTKSYSILKEALNQQVTLREALFDKLMSKTTNNKASNINVDDIKLEISDDAFDISDDEVIDNLNEVISPADAFIGSFVELSELYNNEVLQLHKVKHPFLNKGKPNLKPVNSVLGMTFFPTKYGSIKMMKIYVVLCNINTESDKGIQILAKEIPNFRWDGNYLYINAATGKMLRQIISGVLGEAFI